MAHWIGLVNGFSNPVSKINKVEIYILNGSVKGKMYPWSWMGDQGSKGVLRAYIGETRMESLQRER